MSSFVGSLVSWGKTFFSFFLVFLFGFGVHFSNIFEQLSSLKDFQDQIATQEAERICLANTVKFSQY